MMIRNSSFVERLVDTLRKEVFKSRLTARKFAVHKLFSLNIVRLFGGYHLQGDKRGIFVAISVNGKA